MKPLIASLLLLALLAASGCRSIPFIKSKKSAVEVVGVKDAGTPATVNTDSTKEAVQIPAGSTITKTIVQATANEPAKEVVQIALSAPTILRTEKVRENISTGTIDTAVATKRIEVEAAAESRRPILFIALALLVAAIALYALLPQWKGLYTAAGIGSAITFAAWKLSDIPAWVGVVILGGMGLVALGYKKGELDKDGDGIPDFLQRKTRK